MPDPVRSAEELDLDRDPAVDDVARFHEPSINDLEARLAQARSARDSPDAGYMIESVRRNLERFYPSGGERPERQERLFEEVERISRRLPVHPG